MATRTNQAALRKRLLLKAFLLWTRPQSERAGQRAKVEEEEGEEERSRRKRRRGGGGAEEKEKGKEEEEPEIGIDGEWKDEGSWLRWKSRMEGWSWLRWRRRMEG